LVDRRDLEADPLQILFQGEAAAELISAVPARFVDPAQPRSLACEDTSCMIRRSVLGIADGSRESELLMSFVRNATAQELERVLGVNAATALQSALGGIEHSSQLISIVGLSPAMVADLATLAAEHAYQSDNDYIDGCNLDAAMWQASPEHRDLINRIRQDSLVTSDEVENELLPVLQGLPDRATPTTRAALALLDSPSTAIDEQAGRTLATALKEWFGYRSDLLERGISSATIRGLNITEADLDFHCAYSRVSNPSREIVIAVVDDGTDPGHQANRHALWANAGELADNQLDDDGNGKVDDVNGWDFVTGAAPFDYSKLGDLHGLHVAAIAASGTSRIKLLQLADNHGFDDSRLVTDRRLQALVYAASAGARVVNLSQITDDDHAAPIVQFMANHPEILFVVAAGNDGRRIAPGKLQNHAIASAELDNVVLVAASDLLTGEPASYTNFHETLVNVAFPGDRLSALNGNDARFTVDAGTSQSAPGVANLAAKMLLIAPNLTPAQIKDLLLRSSTPADSWTDVVASGGVIDIATAYALARQASH
jgi:hypothetical protein